MILASGCFDGLHAGHVAYLRAAMKLCDFNEDLVVAVAPDAYIQAEKMRPPIWTQAQRHLVLSVMRGIDLVVFHGEHGAADVIDRLRPRIFVKGRDWQGYMPSSIRAACERTGTEIVLVDSGITQHSSDHAVSALLTP